MDIHREIEITADGSHTLFIPDINEHYHSVNGAVQESRHVFIDAGLRLIEKQSVRVLEIGFGTGLNALLTLLEGENRDLRIEYYSVELYPLDKKCVEALNYEELICPERKGLYASLHNSIWSEEIAVTDHFSLCKLEGDANKLALPSDMDLVYFDAFAPDKQPEMWNQSLFDKLYASMSANAILTTYCAKGEVRRMLQKTGYSVERIPGPPGKREMLRARRLS